MEQQSAEGSSDRRCRAAGAGAGARVSTSLAEINVVPLVDVMLVLLIIFMVTAPMMQQGLQVNLPQARRADAGHRAADLRHASRPTFGRTRIVQLDNDDVRLDILQERVRQAILARDDKSVFIRADGAATRAGSVRRHGQAERRRASRRSALMSKPANALAR